MSQKIEELEGILVTGQFTPADARFLMLSATLGAVILTGDVTKVTELRELLLHFRAKHGYTDREMTKVIATMRQLVEAANLCDPGGALANG